MTTLPPILHTAPQAALNTALQAALNTALDRRASLLARLDQQGTDCMRLFHGATEGRPGLAVDRYGSLLLVQTWAKPLTDAELQTIAQVVDAVVPGLSLCWNHRARGSTFDDHHQPSDDALTERVVHEQGQSALVTARHRGRDPWLYLDFRAARRWLHQHIHDLLSSSDTQPAPQVLNLFAYTGTAGVAVATAGATVLNIDFAASALAVAQRNAQLNNIRDDHFALLQADVLPAARQLAGLPVKGRGTRRKRYARLSARSFDVVVLDPPTWATSAFGAVDIVRDYPSLFKPAVLATRPGGCVLASNHAASVDPDVWLDQLRRCATKAGRPLLDLRMIPPDDDFPSPDGRPPLKVAVATVG